MFEYWKQQVVRELEPAMQRSVGKIAVWDFADYNSVTAEPVPPTRDAQSHMRWYWDAQHYKAALGHVMLDRMFGIEVTDASVPPDYGVRVNAGNIDGHLLAVRQRQQAYEATHADEIAEVRANVEKAVQTQQSLRR